jgi:hypothetical protein
MGRAPQRWTLMLRALIYQWRLPLLYFSFVPPRQTHAEFDSFRLEEHLINPGASAKFHVTEGRILDGMLLTFSEESHMSKPPLWALPNDAHQ